MISGQAVKNSALLRRNKVIKKLTVLILSVWLLCQALPAHSSYRLTELIDTPTARSVDFGSYLLMFRLYGTGSVTGRLQYGIIMQNLTLGVSINAENMVGDSTIKLRRPYLYGKIPFYSGDHIWPAISIGFDEQGYGEFRSDDTYQYSPLGFFVAMSKYGIVPGLNLNFGVNTNHGISSAADQGVSGFTGIDFMLGPEFMLLAEGRDINEDGGQINLGAKYLLRPELSFELSFIDLAANPGPSRILKIVYSGDF